MTQATKREVELGEKTFFWRICSQVIPLRKNSDSRFYRYSNFNSTVFSLTWTFGQLQFLQSFLDRNKTRKFEVRFFLGGSWRILFSTKLWSTLTQCRSCGGWESPDQWGWICLRLSGAEGLVGWLRSCHGEKLLTTTWWVNSTYGCQVHDVKTNEAWIFVFFWVCMSLRHRDVASSALVG